MDPGRRKPPEATAGTLPRGVESLDWLADRPGVREGLGLFARESRWIDDMHQALCRVPAPTFQEQKRADWMAERLGELGWDARLDRGGNVLATLGKVAKDGPVVALTAHLDTVLAPRLPEEIRREGRTRLVGPGVSDNGAGLSGLLAIARAAAEHQAGGSPFGRLLLVANVGEEGEGNLSGMRYLCRQSAYAGRLQTVIVLDGPDTTHVTAEALASRRFEVTVGGPGGHSWSDRGTANPVHALARAITWYLDGRQEVHAGSGATSCNFGVIDGGTTVNAVPAEARVKVDLRAEDEADLDELCSTLASVVEKAVFEENERATSGRVFVRVRETGSRPGGRIDEAAPVLNYLRAVDAWMGNKARLDCASTDANIPLSMGLAALSIGAGGQGGGAHTPQEWYDGENRDFGLRRVYLLALLALLEVGDGR
jgi:acetylornithine deacetylase/succinyl-diaminopimelate desuccinylase-like protein